MTLKMATENSKYLRQGEWWVQHNPSVDTFMGCYICKVLK